MSARARLPRCWRTGSGQPICNYAPHVAGQLPALYDPLQKRGEVPLAREQRKLAAILAKDVVGGSAQAASSDKVEGIDWKRPDLSAN
jgi:hypothetical protein